MRKTLRASFLMLALCGSAFAGDISNPSSSQPPPPPTPSITAEEPAKDGETQTGTVGSFTEMLLNVLESVLALR